MFSPSASVRGIRRKKTSSYSASSRSRYGWSSATRSPCRLSGSTASSPPWIRRSSSSLRALFITSSPPFQWGFDRFSNVFCRFPGVFNAFGMVFEVDEASFCQECPALSRQLCSKGLKRTMLSKADILFVQGVSQLHFVSLMRIQYGMIQNDTTYVLYIM